MKFQKRSYRKGKYSKFGHVLKYKNKFTKKLYGSYAIYRIDSSFSDFSSLTFYVFIKLALEKGLVNLDPKSRTADDMDR